MFQSIENIGEIIASKVQEKPFWKCSLQKWYNIAWCLLYQLLQQWTKSIRIII